MRILWLTTIAAAIIILAIWSVGFKKEFAQINGSAASNQITVTTPQVAALHYLKVDGSEVTNGKLLVYFSLDNDSNDILDAPKTSQIKLTDGRDTYTPSAVSDRQSQPYPQKVLSHSQAFGILTFDQTNIKKADLTFDSMFFENSQDKTFKETATIDTDQPFEASKLRN